MPARAGDPLFQVWVLAHQCPPQALLASDLGIWLEVPWPFLLGSAEPLVGWAVLVPRKKEWLHFLSSGGTEELLPPHLLLGRQACHWQQHRDEQQRPFHTTLPPLWLTGLWEGETGWLGH